MDLALKVAISNLFKDISITSLINFEGFCWRLLKNDQLCALNFDQANLDVDYYTFAGKSTKLTGSFTPS